MSLGVYHDQDGAWEAYRDYERHAVVLRNTATEQRKLIDMADWQQRQMINMGNVYGYAALQGSMGMQPKDERTVKQKLIDSRQQRWYRRMVRMREKRLQRHLGRLTTVGLGLLYLWGAALTVVVTSKVLGWAMTSVLG